MLFSPRLLFALGALVAFSMIGGGLYFQYVLYLDPCPLCIFQRVGYAAIGVACLAGALHNPGPTGRRVYAGLGILGALYGIGIAARHLWLQSLPPSEVPECGPGLDYMLDVLPFTEVLAKVFHGSGECAEVLWRFMGLSIPGWSLVAFSAFLLAGLWLMFGRFQPR